jgi:hypothetical protein
MPGILLMILGKADPPPATVAAMREALHVGDLVDTMLESSLIASPAIVTLK